MSWFKVDDGWHCHPKVVGLSLGACGLWSRCGSWCADQENGGFVPLALPRSYGADPTLIAELLESGLWDEVPKGFQFHDWDLYQPNPQRLAEERAINAKRQAEFRARGKSSPRNALRNALLTDVCGVSKLAPVPVPEPELKDCTIRAPAREEHSPCRIGNEFMLAVNGSLTWDYSSWRRELEVIGEKPETQRTIALETIRGSLWCRTNAHAVSPGHVVKYWNRYASGKEAVTQVLAKRGPSAVPTQSDYAADAAMGDSAWET